MANPEHVSKLREGVEAWNKWRNKNPWIKINLGRADLNNADLSGAYLGYVNLESANLIQARLSDAQIIGANLKSANLLGAYLEGANLSGANLNDTRLSRAILEGANLVDSYLREADLRGTSLESANLATADLSRADLRGADLRGANLNETLLSGVHLGGSLLFETVISKVNLSKAIGLEEIIHSGPSVIDHRTFSLSGELPDVFLRGVGLQDWQIENAKLLQPGLSNAEINEIIYRVYDLRAHQAIQISPLFISYSHANSSFVDIIDKKLVVKGVRFWRDIHDMKAGKMEKQVDRAMRLNQTVLLVLSKESVYSDWVELEATKARKIEKERGKDVLCPIALDDAWKTCSWNEGLRLQIEKYNILDFSKWQDKAVFERQFSKLLNGLDIFYQ